MQDRVQLREVTHAQIKTNHRLKKEATHSIQINSAFIVVKLVMKDILV